MGLLDTSYGEVNSYRLGKNKGLLQPIDPVGILDNYANQLAQNIADTTGQTDYKRYYENRKTNPELAKQALTEAKAKMMDLAINSNPGAVGMFAGIGAKTADKAMLEQAKSLLGQGKPAQEVWKETGWGIAPWDSKPRFEVSDHRATMNGGKLPTEYIDGYGNVESWKIPDTLKHDSLYSTYPELSNVSASFKTGGDSIAEYRNLGESGHISFDSNKKNALVSNAQHEERKAAQQAIKDFDSRPDVKLYDDELSAVNPSDDAEFERVFNNHNGSKIEAERQPLVDNLLSIIRSQKENPKGGFGLLGDDSTKSTTLHELQHAIQSRENFASGGSPDTSFGAGLTKENTMDWAKKAYERSHESSGDPLLAELFDGAKQWDSLTDREKLGWIDQARNDAYRHLAGEAEARLTQHRMNLTPEQRASQYPYDPAYFKQATGVDINNLITRYGDNGPSMMTVWHGSPHRFDKFDMSKIGTGEGAQAYGHGLYTAELPEVARGYQPRSAKFENAMMQKYSEAERRQDYAAMQVYEDFLLHKAPHEINSNIADSGYSAKDLASAQTALKHGSDMYAKQSEGALYKVDIPDEAVARFLDWDKPLSEQADVLPYVQELIKQGEVKPQVLGGSGRNLWESMVNSAGSPDDASYLLNDYGVKGIRYLDGGSRGAGQGSSNFVLFDDKMPRILEVNGQATGLNSWNPGEWKGLLGN